MRRIGILKSLNPQRSSSLFQHSKLLDIHSGEREYSTEAEKNIHKFFEEIRKEKDANFQEFLGTVYNRTALGNYTII